MSKKKTRNLRDVELSKGKQCPFVVTIPRDDRDACNLPLLDEFLRIIHQKKAVYTGHPGERK
jgi:hypothetical protein